MKLLVLLSLATACKKEPPPPANEFEAFERKFVAESELLARVMRDKGNTVDDADIPTSYRAVFVGKSGVFVDRVLVAPLGNLETKRTELLAAIDANVKLLPTFHWRPAITLEVDEEPAERVIGVLRLFAGREIIVNVRRDDPEIPERASQLICPIRFADHPSGEKQDPHLSVLLTKDQMFVGESRSLEFYDLPDHPSGDRDWEKLKVSLQDYKRREAFENRRDAELAVDDPKAKGDQVITALKMMCDAGFPEIAVVSRAELSANPTLDPPVDRSRK